MYPITHDTGRLSSQLKDAWLQVFGSLRRQKLANNVAAFLCVYDDVSSRFTRPPFDVIHGAGDVVNKYAVDTRRLWID